jgi:hypothetical protein
MLGAIAVDVIGSVHERTRIKTKDFPRLTSGFCAITLHKAHRLLGALSACLSARRVRGN